MLIPRSIILRRSPDVMRRPAVDSFYALWYHFPTSKTTSRELSSPSSTSKTPCARSCTFRSQTCRAVDNLRSTQISLKKEAFVHVVVTSMMKRLEEHSKVFWVVCQQFIQILNSKQRLKIIIRFTKKIPRRIKSFINRPRASLLPSSWRKSSVSRRLCKRMTRP
jgi:hypothetical protein